MYTVFQYELPYAHLLTVWQERLADVGEVCGDHFTIRNAVAEDGLMINVRDEQSETFDNSNYHEIVRTHAWLNLLTPMNYAIFHGENLLMLISIFVIGKGVGEISFLTDDNFVKAPLAVRLSMLRSFQFAVTNAPFHRLQAKVKDSFMIGRKFVEGMGFENEGTLKGYGENGADYIIYGLAKNKEG